MISLANRVISLTEAITVYEDAKNKWEKMGVASPYFKRWFRKSRVVDESGNPLEVYHGTKDKFRRFKRECNKFDFGMHFGNVEQANAILILKNGPTSSKQVIPVYLRIEKPIIIDFDMFSYYSIKYKFNCEDSRGGRYFNVDSGGFTAFECLLKFFGKFITPSEELKRKAKETRFSGYSNYLNLAGEFYKQLGEEIKSSGYDGIIYKNEVEADGTSYCVLSPYQVKSTENCGMFNPRSPYIKD